MVRRGVGGEEEQSNAAESSRMLKFLQAAAKVRITASQSWGPGGKYFDPTFVGAAPLSSKLPAGAFPVPPSSTPASFVSRESRKLDSLIRSTVILSNAVTYLKLGGSWRPASRQTQISS